MAQKSFYVDACIYLNLWQKEGDETQGIPYWKLAEDFFEKLEEIDAIIYYSGFLLKELKFILSDDEFSNKTKLFKTSPNFMKIELSDDEFKQARKIESELDYEISFYFNSILQELPSQRT